MFLHGVQEGETAFGPGFVIAAVLDWANICRNETIGEGE